MWLPAESLRSCRADCREAPGDPHSRGQRDVRPETKLHGHSLVWEEEEALCLGATGGESPPESEMSILHWSEEWIGGVEWRTGGSPHREAETATASPIVELQKREADTAWRVGVGEGAHWASTCGCRRQ
ncbi:hypothetical protein NDU88_008314 [Pleurodeles waltl]|uniref:Uncharacterized protein n=1 Tax=Pleurodeles waltl TaxID=8319 RepID=A0AAV7QRE0_PLEWA|nr:hypothetical protein NDU88_008314 [Pleurodeles waltl]